MNTPWWDQVHSTMWRLSGRPDVLRLMESARRVARTGIGEYADTARVLRALDDAGLTSIVTSSTDGLALSVAASVWELAWIDAGAAVCSLSGALAHMVVRDIGTGEQRSRYLDNPARRHGAVCLTEPLPGAGAEAASLHGRIGVAEWIPGEEPLLSVEKRGRFTSHMDFAEFVIAAVESDDPRLNGSCLVFLEPRDAGVFDRGSEVKKLGHSLSSTTNPVFQVTVPAGRILGGYTIEDGIIIPKFNHRDGLGAAFRRTRAVMGLVTASKLLSTVYEMVALRHTCEDVVAIWAAGEAAASFGFAAARLSDEADRSDSSTALAAQVPVICPAAKLFSTDVAAAMLPRAGEPGYRLMDAQLEAMYLGPEAIQRRQISAAMSNDFLDQFDGWAAELAPYARTLAVAMELWRWTLHRLRRRDESGAPPIYREARQSVTFPMADGLCWLLGARALTLDVLTLSEVEGSEVSSFYRDLAAIQAVSTAGRIEQLCTGLLFGHDAEMKGAREARKAFAGMRARLNASLAGVAHVRQRANEFIRKL